MKFVQLTTRNMLLLDRIILLVTIISMVRADPDLDARLEALEARVERSEMREIQLEARAERSEKRELQLEKEIEQLKNKLAIQNSSSFFSVQFTADTTIPHGDILDFDDVIVNYGDDYILSGGLYM